jgi:hypothetical protein
VPGGGSNNDSCEASVLGENDAGIEAAKRKGVYGVEQKDERGNTE